jgi:hypothetical protein
VGPGKNGSYGWRILISLDQSINVLFGGYPDETISSRWGRMIRDARHTKKKAPWYARVGCAVLNRLDKDHCAASIEYDDAGNPRPHHMVEVARVVEAVEKAVEKIAEERK